MEKEILKIIIQLNYYNELEKLINSDKTTFPFPLKLKLTPGLKTLNLFIASYYDKYKEVLLENALVYAIETKNKDYLDFIKENLSNIKETVSSDMAFKLKTSELAIKNFIRKSFIKDKEIKVNSMLNKKTISNNKDLFDKIQKAFIKKESISNFYMNIILDFISLQPEENKEDYLSKLLTSKELDNNIIKKYGLNDKDLEFLKLFIIRKILADNFIEITVFNYEEELDNKLREIDSTYQYNEDKELDDEMEYDDEFSTDDYKEYDIKALDHIEKCINSNTYLLPNDYNLRFYMINNFLAYSGDKNKIYEIQTIESDKKLLKTLKQINPLYKFDLMKFD